MWKKYTVNGYDHRTKKEESKEHRDYPRNAPCCGCAKHCLPVCGFLQYDGQ